MNRRNKKFVRSFKDYLGPIVGVLILIFIGYSLFSSSGDAPAVIDPNQPTYTVNLDPAETESYIESKSGKKSKIETQGVALHLGEKLSIAAAGSATLTLNDSESLALNKLGSLGYLENNAFTLYMSDVFVDVSHPYTFDLRYMKVTTGNEKQVFNLTQNEVASTIYVLHGNVSVQNLAGVTLTVSKGEKLTILKNDGNSKDADLMSQKELIDEYTKSDDWYAKNNGDTFLNLAQSQTQTATGNSLTGSTWSGSLTAGGGFNTSGFGVIGFDILDESDSDKEYIDVTGTLYDDLAYKVEINGLTADINPADRTFILKNVKLTSRINDIVYRIFDESNRIIDKGVFTVYYTKGTSTTQSQDTNVVANVENYSLSKSPLYTIVSPKSNPYITSESNVRIEGMVPARTVEKIIINDFQLTKFPQYGTYWYYFANSEFGNLKEGLNIYKIQYYGAENKLIYENIFTIVKEAPKAVSNPAVQTIPSPEVSSDEVASEETTETSAE